MDRREFLRKLGATAAVGAMPNRTEASADETETVKESRGALHARLLDEYIAGLKTLGRSLEAGPASSIMDILHVPTVEDPEAYSPEERTFVYGPLSVDLERTEKLPVIPAKDNSTSVYYNGVHVAPKSMLTLSRFANTARLSEDALAARKEGREALLVDFESSEHESRLVTSITSHSTAELHATRAVLHGLIYRSSEAKKHEERAPVFVSGVLVDHSRFSALSAMVERAYCAGVSSEEEREWRRKSLRGTLLFLPALGHASVRDLIRSVSGMGAPFLDATQNVVGIVKDLIILSDEQRPGEEEPLPLSAFLVEGPDALRVAPSISLVPSHPPANSQLREGR